MSPVLGGRFLRLPSLLRPKPTVAPPARQHDEQGEIVVMSGNIAVSGAMIFPHGLRLRGSLSLGPGARLGGDVWVDGNIVLARGAAVHGRVFGTGGLRMDQDAVVGPASVAGEAVLAHGAHVEGPLVCDRLVLRVVEREEREGVSHQASVLQVRAADAKARATERDQKGPREKRADTSSR